MILFGHRQASSLISEAPGGQTLGASEIKLRELPRSNSCLKKKKEGSCPTSEAPGVRTRTFLFLLQEVDLGGSRSLPAEAPAV